MAELDWLRSEVAALQSALQAKDAAHARDQSALQAKDAAHARELAAAQAAHQQALESALRMSQEREGTRLQALQMRLYLQTSRVDTLERALADHVAAVGLPTQHVVLDDDQHHAATAITGGGLPLGQQHHGPGDGEQRPTPPKTRALAQAVAVAAGSAEAT